MNIAIYSDIAGTGKSYLAEEIGTSTNMNVVRLDPQDGGSLANASGVDNSVLDCAPYFEYAEEAVKVSDKMIYIFSANKSWLEPVYLLKLADRLTGLKAINSKLEVEVRLSSRDKWTKETSKTVSDFSNHFDFISTNF